MQASRLRPALHWHSPSNTLQSRCVASSTRPNYWHFIHYSNDSQGEARGPSIPTEQELSDEEKMANLEAVLFLTREGISSRKLAKLAGLADATEARTLVRQLNEELDGDGRSYRVEEVAGGYLLVTRPQFAPWLRRLAHIPAEVRLSQTALETLAVVAYRQPVLRANIEAIRGVGCSEVLKQLMDMDLVRISGRSEDLGRPYLYGTTRRFLQIFGLRSADRLPRIDWVNEPQLKLSSTDPVGIDSGAKESAVNKSITATAILQEASITTATQPTDAAVPSQHNVPVAVDDDDDDWDDEEDFDDDDDDVSDDYDDEESDDWDDDDEEDDDVEDEDTGEWQEVGDDDDGWEDDDDDEEDDDKQNEEDDDGWEDDDEDWD